MQPMHIDRKEILRFVATAGLLVALFLYAKFAAHQRVIALLPPELQVKQILYEKESDDLGWGPGSNESGIFVFALPENISKEIQSQGYGFFVAMRKAKNPASTYVGWYGTPIDPAPYWSVPQDGSASKLRDRKPSIEMYLNRGVRIDIPLEIQQLVNSSLATQGNYFALPRRGLIIVIPHLNRVVYAYAS